MDDQNLLAKIIGSGIAALFSLVVWGFKKRKEEVEELRERIDKLERFDSKMEAYLNLQEELRKDVREVRDTVNALKGYLRQEYRE